ncbi:hypothetical protein NFC81_00410 [Salinispirillum sp. LH 10-3-1]|uniref:Uncharacterized protein n=1 Tax=Salinispirillum sp. LH 10-3-1 TaxID=2952525 RepID=A0AB38YGA8_9GAMM
MTEQQTEDKKLFSRRNMWILIFVLIPLIYVLNEMGGEETTSNNAEPLQTLFDMGQVPVQRERISGQPVWWAALPGSGVVEIGVLEPRLPTARIPIPDSKDLVTTARNDKFIVYLRSPVEQAALEVSLDFLTEWLPPPSPDTTYVLVGDLNAALTEQLVTILSRSRGPAIPFVAQPRAAITRLTSPPTGTQDQLAFVMAVELLRDRLDGYDIQLSWDHRGERSIALINSSLIPEHRQVPSQAEFERVQAAFLDQAYRTERSVQQISRYMMTMAAFGLSTDYMATQTTRTRTLDYATFSRVWRERISATQ